MNCIHLRFGLTRIGLCIGFDQISADHISNEMSYQSVMATCVLTGTDLALSLAGMLLTRTFSFGFNYMGSMVAICPGAYWW